MILGRQVLDIIFDHKYNVLLCLVLPTMAVAIFAKNCLHNNVTLKYNAQSLENDEYLNF